MPLYEYLCDACGHRFETIQKFSDPLVEQCPKCGSAVHKLQSAPAFHLKGSGWYATDYAKKDTPGAGDNKPASSEKTAPAETKEGQKESPKESPKTETAAPASTSTPASTTTKTGA